MSAPILPRTGRSSIPALRRGCARWTVPYAEGGIRAVAGGAECVLKTPGKGVVLQATADRTVMRADGEDVAIVEIALYGANGSAALDEAVYCQLVGDIALLGMENGACDDLTPYAEPWRTTRNGRAIAYIRAGRCPGACEAHFRTRTGLKCRVDIELIPKEN